MRLKINDTKRTETRKNRKLCDDQKGTGKCTQCSHTVLWSAEADQRWMLAESSALEVF